MYGWEEHDHIVHLRTVAMIKSLDNILTVLMRDKNVPSSLDTHLFQDPHRYQDLCVLRFHIHSARVVAWNLYTHSYMLWITCDAYYNADLILNHLENNNKEKSVQMQ